MNALRCVIFDMDGTLTQTNRLIFDSFNYIGQKYAGRVYSEQEITAMFGPPEEGALLRIVEEGKLDMVMRDYLDYYRGNHGLAQVYPGIKELLELLKQRRIFVALFTGKGKHTTAITLEEFGLQSYFDFIVTGNDVAEHKPSPEGIGKILAHFQLKPEEVVMVGDSVADVKAAHGAGVRIAAVLWDSFTEKLVKEMHTDFLFHSVPEFSSWLRGQCD
ncbi:MAG: HAD-IA family hydrolase [Bacteroidota bacterium]